MECEYCLLSFENEKLLKKHNTECETCNKYKNILFTCKKCDFSTVGLINIDKHIENNCVEKVDDISYEIISDDTPVRENIDNSILTNFELKICAIEESSLFLNIFIETDVISFNRFI